MTRATLLHVLERPTALGPADVRELEQLAQAFPYCQTAHLLLAKAAHDQGTMLAGQRLRRAATYAADRTLLRRLIEQVEPAVNREAPPAVEPEVAAPIQKAPAAEAAVEASEEPTVLPASASIAPMVAEPAVAPEPPTAVDASDVQDDFLPSVEIELFSEQPAAHNEDAPAEAEPAVEKEVTAPEEPTAVEADARVLVDEEVIEVPATAEVAELASEITVAEEAVAIEEGDLPAQAPAIRPPVEVGEARFEFGLAEAPAPPALTYELPGLVDEWAASAVTLSLGSRSLPAGSDALAAGPDLFAAAESSFTPAAFTGDAAVGYGYGESSRLGFSLQLLNLLTDKLEAAECTTTQAASAQPPAMPVPPAGAFFEPDPLLLNHWATHCPPAPAQPTSLDLINNFLRRQPRLTRPAMLPPSPTVQADLSVRSTQAEPDLVSESLARILVRQGKTARAIEVYEKLMVKQPDKASHFAVQIQQLQLPG
ncbi:MAG TPA: hypothetical protein VF630_05710 [Hymenobacter sp.]